MAREYIVRPEWEPLPGIGAGPLSEDEARERCEARGVPWDAFLRLYRSEDAEDGAPLPAVAASSSDEE